MKSKFVEKYSLRCKVRNNTLEIVVINKETNEVFYHTIELFPKSLSKEGSVDIPDPEQAELIEEQLEEGN